MISFTRRRRAGLRSTSGAVGWLADAAWSAPRPTTPWTGAVPLPTIIDVCPAKNASSRTVVTTLLRPRIRRFGAKLSARGYGRTYGPARVWTGALRECSWRTRPAPAAIGGELLET